MSEKQWPADTITRRKVLDLIPYARNSRTHSNEQIGQIAASIKEWGWTVPVLIDEEGGLLAGHGRVLAAQRLGIDEIPTMTAKGWTEAQKKAYVIADNKLALNAGWDSDILKIEMKDIDSLGFNLELTGFGLDEMASLFDEPPKNDDSENSYTKKIERPVYEPTGPKPQINEMFDDSYTKQLMFAIEGSELSDEEKIFLRLAAGRHTVFNFEVIANYYAHASKECQDLMEDNALVIVDINKAIEKGFVVMSDKISQQYSEEYPDE